MKNFATKTVCRSIPWVAIALVGCNQPETPAAHAPSAAAAATPTANRGSLHIEPAALRQCEIKQGVGVVVQVAWDASAAGVNTAKVWVQAPGGERKLWTAGGATGSQATGPWTSPGTAFILTDGNDQKLAQAVVRAVPCP